MKLLKFNTSSPFLQWETLNFALIVENYNIDLNVQRHKGIDLNMNGTAPVSGYK